MAGESSILDNKATFEHDSQKARLGLLRDVIAIANSGGGKIVIGNDEVSDIGVTKEVAAAVDSSKVAEWLSNFASPAPVDLSHDIRQVGKEKYVVTLIISAAEFPLVASKRGIWKGADSKRDRPLFEVGDVLIRHSTRTEKANYEDLRRWIVRAKETERSAILDRLSTFIRLPEGADLLVVSQAGQPIDTPGHLLDNAVRRRDHDPNHLLSPGDLLWLFQLRQNYDYSESALHILIASALRRNPTLYWWLLKADENPDLIANEIARALNAADRDKSDAARSIAELASIYLDRNQLREVLSSLRASRYKHFRDQATEWQSREQTQAQIAARINSAALDRRPMLSHPRQELEARATEVAARLARAKGPAAARTLSDLTRAIWALNSKHADFVRESREGAA